jgi:hypothetical protein
MSRSVPGFGELEEGREFLYVEVRGRENFRRVIDGALASHPHVPLPRSGGAIEEKVHLRLPDSTLLLGMSYTGDLAGWREKIVSFCKETQRRWAVPRDQGLAISDGTEIALASCGVTFES